MNIKFVGVFGFLLLLLVSCMAIITASPQKRNLAQRLQSFPVNDLPLRDSASIYWDSHLIPFIEAQNDADCAFLLGMVHAHLRLSQITLVRRVVEGRLAESIGPFATDLDFSLRIVNLGSAADSIEKILPEATKIWLQHFVRGLNFYQDNMTEAPPEFKLLAIQPEPWRVQDIIKIGRLASADVNWFNWFQWLKFRNKPYWPEIWERFLELGFQSTPSFQENLSFVSSNIKSGSNALVIGANLSADGQALLATDPHLGLQLPNIWLIAGYHCPSFHVVGLMFPGVPMVLVGRNESIAWAGTNMRSASSDLYQLTVDSLNHLDAHAEKIKVRWWKDKKVIVRSTSFGPILSDIPFFKNNHRIFAMKWVGHQVTDEYSSFFKLNQARNWYEFRQAFETYGVSGQNFLYADGQGNIGMVPAVKIPRRQSLKPADFLLAAANPHHQWNGLLGTLELPSALNPAEGFIVSANNRPVINDPPLGYFFSANDRVERLSQLIREHQPWDLAGLKRIQRDVYVPSAVALRDLLITNIQQFQLIQPDDRTAKEFFNQLQQWDGNYTHEARGPVVFQMLLAHLIRDFYGKKYDRDFAEALLGSEHANRFLIQDFSQAEEITMKTALAQAIPLAVKDARKFKSWGDMHRLNVSHILGRIPIIGGRFRFGNYPADGSYNSVMKTAHAITNQRHDTFYGANSRFIASMRDLDENYFVLLGGQDGWPGSENFVDQVSLWLKGEYIQIPLRLDNVRKAFPHRLSFSKLTGRSQ
ncbi:MAG: penicillin acylase family protein [candidate division KSB1 bacterium]|nr:penicillin acylase family protein [candidate division KSB1 bacterium]MDZ7318178.1 penicillin acylase family protein [candidate division KSB1 bacterium]MDZ7340680.1 penicillin acylase family protein [candidate division KSB1 bacterium]